MDTKFGLLLAISAVLSYEANWSAIACAIAGGAIAFVYFWQFIRRHKIFGFLIAGLTAFLIAVNMFGTSNWINNSLILLAPPFVMFIFQYKGNMKKSAV